MHAGWTIQAQLDARALVPDARTLVLGAGRTAVPKAEPVLHSIKATSA